MKIFEPTVVLTREDEANYETYAGGNKSTLCRVAADGGLNVAECFPGLVLHLLAGEAFHALGQMGDVGAQSRYVFADLACAFRVGIRAA